MRASVVIPTYRHFATLPFAVKSVQNQGVEDIEILIVGDGVDDATRAAAQALQAGDPRIRFFDLPKGPRRGELNRDHVLQQAQGRIICYATDDDLWLPGHFEAMEAALEHADFVGAMHVDVSPTDRIRAWYFDVNAPEFVEPWVAWKPNKLGTWASDGFGLSNAGHRRGAYLRLATRWSTTPEGVPTDNSMWHRFRREPRCRMTFLRFPVSLSFEGRDRKGWTPQQFAQELERWSAIIAGPDGMARVMRGLLADLGDRLLAQSISDSRERAALAAERERLLEMLSERDRRRYDLLSSTSWRAMAAMRMVSRTIRRLWRGAG